MLSWSTAFFLVSVAGVVIYLCFFCCEDDDEYSNSLASPPLPTTTTWLLYRSSPPSSYPRGEVSATIRINYGDGTHRTSLPSHYVRETGQIPSTSCRAQASDHDGYGYRSSLATTYAGTRGSRDTLSPSARAHVSHPPQSAPIRVSTTTTTDYTNDDVRRPRLVSPSSDLIAPAPSLPPTHYCVHCSSTGHLGTNSSLRVVPNSGPPNPVPHARHGVEIGASANAQEMKTVRGLREQARRRKREMHAAHKLAKNARKNGDYRAEQRHRHDAMVHGSQMKVLDDWAAKIIFRENNKVRVHLARCQKSCSTLVIPDSPGRNGRSPWSLRPGGYRARK